MFEADIMHHTFMQSSHSKINSSNRNALATLSDHLMNSMCREIGQMIERGFGGLDSFRSILRRNSSGQWCWDDSLGSEFDLMQNVVFIDEPITREIDEILVEDIYDEDLPKDKPLWRLYVYEKDSCSLLIFKFHHTIADGYGFSQVFGRMVDCSESEIEAVSQQQCISVSKKVGQNMKETLLQQIWSWIVTAFFVLICPWKTCMFSMKPKGDQDWIYDRSNEDDFPMRKIVRTSPIKMEAVKNPLFSFLF
jgi:hypothetical protein